MASTSFDPFLPAGFRQRHHARDPVVIDICVALFFFPRCFVLIGGYAAARCRHFEIGAHDRPADGVAYSSMEVFGRDITGELVVAARKGGVRQL